jgi:hypothetical protein
VPHTRDVSDGCSRRSTPLNCLLWVAVVSELGACGPSRLEPGGAHADPPTTSDPCAPQPPAPTEQVRAAVILMTGGNFAPDHLGATEWERRRQEAIAAPGPYLDALEVLVIAADDARLSEVHPGTLFDVVAWHDDRHARHVAACTKARYAAAVARAKVIDEESARTKKRLETALYYVTAHADRSVICALEPCAAGELCVHPCCSGPCTPAAPYCIWGPDVATSACNDRSITGADVACHCP